MLGMDIVVLDNSASDCFFSLTSVVETDMLEMESRPSSESLEVIPISFNLVLEKSGIGLDKSPKNGQERKIAYPPNITLVELNPDVEIPKNLATDTITEP